MFCWLNPYLIRVKEDIEKDESHHLTVYPIDRFPEITDQMREGIIAVYNRITGKSKRFVEICEEYEMEPNPQ